jgi:kynureninase
MSWSTFAERAAVLDAADSLSHIRLLFDIPKDVMYFDGNSLGPMTIRSREVLDHTINVEWRERLIRSWNEDWLAMPLRIGNKIAPIIGATTDTVIACDNTSINLHKALMAAVALRPSRTEIVIDINNFPT